MAQGWKRDYTRYKGFFLNVLSVYNSKPNLKIYLELILSLATITIFSIFAIKPTILTIIDINNDITSKETTIAKLEKKLIDLQKASSILQTQVQNLDLIDEAVPSSADLERTISQVESLATVNSIKISSLTSSELILRGVVDKKKKANDVTPLPNSPNELPISFSLVGDYQNLFQFLQSIENLRRPLKIDSFVFGTTKSADEKKLITLTITGRLPFLLQETNKTK